MTRHAMTAATRSHVTANGLTRLLWVALTCLLAAFVLPESAAAQGVGTCASCVRCKKCERDSWGGDHCDFKGDGNCCRERGGNCNPALALNVDADDRRIVDTTEGDVVVVRLAGDTFGAWACSGNLTHAFEAAPDGSMAAVEADDLADWRHRYRFDKFVRTVSARLLADGAEGQ